MITPVPENAFLARLRHADAVLRRLAALDLAESNAPTKLFTGRKIQSDWVFRAQPVPYDWVPDGTPHAEKAVVPPELNQFRVQLGR